jgi:hypothetical protein
MTPAFTLTGNTKGVYASLSSNVVGGATIALYAMKTNIPCEVTQSWSNQYDADNAGMNTYLNKLFYRTENAGNISDVTVTLVDTTTISGQIQPKTVTGNLTSNQFAPNIVSWIQFNLEANGESHLLQWSIPPNTGGIIMTMLIIQGEARGVVYETVSAP